MLEATNNGFAKSILYPVYIRPIGANSRTNTVNLKKCIQQYLSLKC